MDDLTSTTTSASSGLERGYRRLLAWYPRSFRKENEEEILTVLLATAREDQRRPSLGESADLIKGAVRMRMGLSRSPRTVLHAVRLMYLGAAAQVAVLITVLLTASDIRAAVQAAVAVHHDPALTAQALQLVQANLVADYIFLPVAVLLWIFSAWANGKGYDWARVVAIGLFGILSVGMLVHLVQGSAEYAPAAVIGSGVEWVIGLAAVVLILQKRSWPYYVRRPATR
jgi:hypothetical protein